MDRERVRNIRARRGAATPKRRKRAICKHNTGGICQALSDEVVKQPCIEGPCPFCE